MITTFSKEKLPKGYSYPLGLEKLNDVLSHLSAHNKAQVRFVWRDAYWKSEWQKRIKSKGIITVFSIETSRNNGHYQLCLYSVPSEYSSKVAQLLLDCELPSLNFLLIKDEEKIKRIYHQIKYDLAEQNHFVD